MAVTNHSINLYITTIHSINLDELINRLLIHEILSITINFI